MRPILFTICRLPASYLPTLTLQEWLVVAERQASGLPIRHASCTPSGGPLKTTTPPFSNKPGPCSFFSRLNLLPPPCSMSKRDVSTNHPMRIFRYSRKASPFSRYVSSTTVAHLETALDTYIVAYDLPTLFFYGDFTADRPSNPVVLEWAIDHVPPRSDSATFP